MVPMSFRPKPKHREKVLAVARERGVTISALFRQMIEDLPEENKNAAQPGSNDSVFAN